MLFYSILFNWHCCRWEHLAARAKRRCLHSIRSARTPVILDFLFLFQSILTVLVRVCPTDTLKPEWRGCRVAVVWSGVTFLYANQRGHTHAHRHARQTWGGGFVLSQMNQKDIMKAPSPWMSRCVLVCACVRVHAYVLVDVFSCTPPPVILMSITASHCEAATHPLNQTSHKHFSWH